MCISSLCRAQLVSTTLALKTTSYLLMETEYIPWQSALDNLHYYYLMLDCTEVYQPMQVHHSTRVSDQDLLLYDFSVSSQEHGSFKWLTRVFIYKTMISQLIMVKGKAVSTNKPAFSTHLCIILSGLHKEAGDSPLPVLQEHDIKLDPYSWQTHWPVSIYLHTTLKSL